MHRFATRRYSRDEVLGLLDPVIREWFAGRFAELTEPQAYAIPHIHRGENVLVSSPTGSGKTLTAFLSVLNELFIMHREGRLEDRIHCVYISPLKALANDINRNLTEPLAQIRALAQERGHAPPDIRVGVRSGDTPVAERQRMSRKPPHIFITTPESLSIVLSTPKFRENLRGVSTVIVDEIHEISSSKRGTFLSLTLERLQEYAEEDFNRIGLSATQAPIDEIGRFLVGQTGGGKYRPLTIVESRERKGLDLRILCPVDDMTALPYEVVNSRMYDMLKELVEKHRTTLIFTNTRSGTESVVLRLKERGVEQIAAHHGSLSRETRLDVEERLRNGELRCVVCSTSLELGIDIGHIDLVCQIGSPKSIAKGLQRVGRAGHGVYQTSKGRIMVFDSDDLVECTVLVRSAYDGKIDRIRIPHGALDVLAQGVVGMSLERRWTLGEAYRVIRRAYPYTGLKRDDLLAVVRYLAGQHDFESVYGKIWWDEAKKEFGIKKGSRVIYFLNSGTIMEECNYRVFSERGAPLGNLSEKFVERLSPGDIFVLGGKTYEFERSRGMKVFVKDAHGRKPTIPSWSGEMLPRSYDLSIEVGKFREKVAGMADGDAAAARLMDDYCIDGGSARTILSHFTAQKKMIPDVPTHRRVLLEGYINGRGNRNIIFHYAFGRRVNDALSRAYAYALSQDIGGNVRVTLTDDGFVLTFQKDYPVERAAALVTPANLEPLLRASLLRTELFRQRFRHCALRSFMLLRNYKGRDIPASRQVLHANKILEVFIDEVAAGRGKRWLEFPVVKETFREILHEAMDIAGATEVVGGIASGAIAVAHTAYAPVPSPFAHNAVLSGVSDIILMEDRSALLRELHRQVLRRVMGEEALARQEAGLFDHDTIEKHFRSRMPPVRSAGDIPALLNHAGPLGLLQERGRSVFSAATGVAYETVRGWCIEHINGGRVVSLWLNGPAWVTGEQYPLFRAALAPARGAPTPEEEEALAALASGNGAAKPDGKMCQALERKFLAYRSRVAETGETAEWAPARPDPGGTAAPSRDDAIRFILGQGLGAWGPQTAAELAHGSGLDEPTVTAALERLEEGGEVVAGHFVRGEEDAGRQFMLSKDRKSIEAARAGQVDEEALERFLLRKYFSPLPTIGAYFDRFGEASLAYDLFNHVAGFDVEEWWRLRKDGSLLQGRFVRGRVTVIRKEDAPLFLSAYRRENLDRTDRRVLSIIVSKGAAGATIAEITEEAARGRALRAVPADRIKESVEKLERNIYLVRAFTERRDWSSRNRYRAFRVRETARIAGCARELVMRALRAHGPLPAQALRWITDFTFEDVSSVLAALAAEKVASTVNVGGAECWILSEELPQLNDTGAAPAAEDGDRARILSLYDPYSQRIWMEITGRYGEGWYFPVVRGGRLCGMVERWQMSGCIDVREVQVEDPSLLGPVLDELARTVSFHTTEGMELIRLRRAGGVDAPAIEKERPDAHSLLAGKGWKRVQDFYLLGDADPRSFPAEDVMHHILYRQHIHPDSRYPNSLAAIAGMGGVHSDFELALRCSLPMPLHTLRRTGHVVTGLMVPEHFTYATWRDFLIYKRAKSRPLTENMAILLQRLPPRQPLSRRALYESVDMGREEFARALKALYSGLYILRDTKNMYIRVVEPAGWGMRWTAAAARKRVLQRAVENFGVVSAERLAAYTGHEFRMSEVRAFLKEGEKEGTLVKGYFITGDGALCWALSAEVGEIGKRRVAGRFVLSPYDALAHYLREDIRRKFGMGTCFVIFQGAEMVGAFKAKRRGPDLLVTKFAGGPDEQKTLHEFARRWGMRVSFGREKEPEEEDWDIMVWYERHGK